MSAPFRHLPFAVAVETRKMQAFRAMQQLRVLIVDDSAAHRRLIAAAIANADGVEVAGEAADGEAALAMVRQLRPDVITLDLEMPKMDGFSFLRLVMSQDPTPVIVVSSYGQRENVLKALEIGALDFLPKPDARTPASAPADFVAALLKKLNVARLAKMEALSRPAQKRRPSGIFDSIVPPPGPTTETVPEERTAERVVVIASGTGGPSALLQLAAELPTTSSAAIVVAQHMPERFTRSFAERLRRKGTWPANEVAPDDWLLAGHIYVCPGGRSVELDGNLESPRLVVRSPEPGARYVPSGDLLFASAARVFKDRASGVVLTGMGDDGTEGSRAIAEAGGDVWVESESSAVVFGMPSSALEANVANESLSLSQIAARIRALG